MFAFHHVRNVFDSPGQKPGFCFSALTHIPYLRPQPPSPLGPYFSWRWSCGRSGSFQNLVLTALFSKPRERPPVGSMPAAMVEGELQRSAGVVGISKPPPAAP